MWNSNYHVNCPSNVETFKFYATKYDLDVWGNGGAYPIWAEADYLDENGDLITAQIKQPPQGSNIPVTLDFDIQFDEIPTAKSVLFKIWIYSPIYEQATQYNITITRV